MKRFFINVLLFFVALLLLFTIGLYGLIYALIFSLFNYSKVNFVGYWTDLIYSINLGIDMIGNVMLSVFLNKNAIIDDKIYPFGDVRHTISHVLAVNHIKHNNVTPFGLWIINILDKIDKDHTQKSLDF